MSRVNAAACGCGIGYRNDDGGVFVVFVRADLFNRKVAVAKPSFEFASGITNLEFVDCCIEVDEVSTAVA